MRHRNSTTMKRCPLCGHNKPLISFTEQRHDRDDIVWHVCNVCRFCEANYDKINKRKPRIAQGWRR